MSTMKSRLKAVKPEAAEPAKPKVLIFGKPGVGKTWFSLDFPRVYYIDVEGGANLKHYTEKLAKAGGMYLGPEHGSNDFSVVLEQVQALATEEHPYRTLVIDSVSHLFGSEVANEQERLASERKKDEYGLSRKSAISYMRRIVNWLDRVDMNVILVAHQKDEYGLNQQTGQREVVGATFDCWDKVEYLLHLALWIRKQGPSRYASVRKSRLLGFPDGDTFELSFDGFADRYGRDVIEGEVKHIQLATVEQIADLTKMLEHVRMPDDWLDKCLKKGKADSVNELTTEAIDKMIKMLKEKSV